jgi:hypothetical protein
LVALLAGLRAALRKLRPKGRALLLTYPVELGLWQNWPLALLSHLLWLHFSDAV